MSLENILSRDCSSFSRDDLESSSMRRRRPCCGCPGRSRVKAGAGGELRTEAEREARRLEEREGRRERGGRLRGHSAGTRGPAELDGGGGGGSGHGGRRLGLFRQRCPPRPAGGAGAARGSRGLCCLRRWTWGGASRFGGGCGGGGEGGAGAVHRELLEFVSR